MTFDVCPLSTEYDNDVLTRNLVTVIDYLDVESIRPHLRQARVINRQDYLELLKIRDDSPKEQAEVLVEIIKQKGIEGFRKFLHVLKCTAVENPGHMEIISALEPDIIKVNVMLAETDIHERTEPIIEQEILCHTSSHCKSHRCTRAQVEQHRWVNTKCLVYVSSAHAPVQVRVKSLVLNTCSPVILPCAINSHSLVLLIITQNHAQITLQTTRYFTWLFIHTTS